MPPVVTRILVLGTDHSPQLAVRSYEPARLRAYLLRLRPDAICVEATPDAFARGAIPDFIHEARHIALPFAAAHGIPVHPIDWVPPADDQRLAWGVPDLLEPPLVRLPGSYWDFLAFPDPTRVSQGLFFAEDPACAAEVDAWSDGSRRDGERDFPRRLGLYRTFMQAMRVKAAAARHPGGTVLVVVGYMHKYDMEKVLKGAEGLSLVQPSAAGPPTDAETAAARTPEDDWAVATFNVLGQQAHRGAVDWPWVDEVLARLPAGPESALLLARRDVRKGLAGRERFLALAAAAASDRPFTFDGVADRRRLDSYFDPFGNLTVRQRALLEAAREAGKAGETAAAEALRAQVAAGLTARQTVQLDAYWPLHVRNTP